jgi:hypothetical protein
VTEDFTKLYECLRLLGQLSKEQELRARAGGVAQVVENLPGKHEFKSQAHLHIYIYIYNVYS